MGCSPSYPVTRSPIIFEPNAYFDITGKTYVPIVTFILPKNSCSMISCDTHKIAQLPEMMIHLLVTFFRFAVFNYFVFVSFAYHTQKDHLWSIIHSLLKLIFFLTIGGKVFPFFRLADNPKILNRSTRKLGFSKHYSKQILIKKNRKVRKIEIVIY